MAEQWRVFRLVRIVPKSGCADAFEQQIVARYRERTGFPGMLSFQLMRGSAVGGGPAEIAITTLWQSRAAIDRYVSATGGALISPDVAGLVESVSVSEYELVASDEYDVLRPVSETTSS